MVQATYIQTIHNVIWNKFASEILYLNTTDPNNNQTSDSETWETYFQDLYLASETESLEQQLFCVWKSFSYVISIVLKESFKHLKHTQNIHK